MCRLLLSLLWTTSRQNWFRAAEEVQHCRWVCFSCWMWACWMLKVFFFRSHNTGVMVSWCRVIVCFQRSSQELGCKWPARPGSPFKEWTFVQGLCTQFLSIATLATDVKQLEAFCMRCHYQILRILWCEHVSSAVMLSLLLLLVCVSFTIIGQPRNSVLIRRV